MGWIPETLSCDRLGLGLKGSLPLIHSSEKIEPEGRPPAVTAIAGAGGRQIEGHHQDRDATRVMTRTLPSGYRRLQPWCPTRRGAGAGRRRPGRMTRKQAPAIRRERSWVAVPPCRRTISSTTASPMPEPGTFALRRLGPRSNCSHMASSYLRGCQGRRRELRRQCRCRCWRPTHRRGRGRTGSRW